MFILSIPLGILEPYDGRLCSFVVSVFDMLEKCLFRTDALSSGCICNSFLIYGGGTLFYYSPLLSGGNDLYTISEVRFCLNFVLAVPTMNIT